MIHGLDYEDRLEFDRFQSSAVVMEHERLLLLAVSLRCESKPWMIVCIMGEVLLTIVDGASTYSTPSATAVPTASSGARYISSTIPPNTPNPSAYLPLDPSIVPALPYPTSSAYLPLDSTTEAANPSAYLPLDSTTSTATPSAYLPLDSTTEAANPSAYLPLDPSTTAVYV